MPFITEELWQLDGAGDRDHYALITAKWPAPEAKRRCAGRQVGHRLADPTSSTKSARLRAELNIPSERHARPHVIGGDAGTIGSRSTANAATLSRMAQARIAASRVGQRCPTGSAQIVVDGTTVAFPLGDAIDLDAEKSRLAKAIAAAEKDRDGLAARLANPAFTDRAKPEAVEKARADHDARAAEAERLCCGLGAVGLVVLRRRDLDRAHRDARPSPASSRRSRRRSRSSAAAALPA